MTAYTRMCQIRDHIFSLAVRHSFATFGPGSRLALPVQIQGAAKISIGSGVFVGPGSWLLAQEAGARLEIGDGTAMSGMCVVSAVESVMLGRKVMLGRNVHIADHRHGFAAEDQHSIDRPLEDRRPVRIEDGAWLGQNVVVLPGVTIGEDAVVGANSVVRVDVAPRTVVVGAPTRVVREL